ncbi:CBS domain-containing protein, partial [bacterium]|nr:CBS domain-containing protein [bacterium]
RSTMAGKSAATKTAPKASKTKKAKKSESMITAKAAPVKSGTAKKTTAVRVRSLMTADCVTCRPDDNVAAAASGMWRADCGSLPVLDASHRPCGWITDRDISMALGMQPVRAADLPVSRVMSGPVLTCTPNEKVTDALARMAERRVRRLAVVDDAGELVGVLSVADALRAAKSRASSDAPAVAQVMDALRAISTPHKASKG